MVASPPPPLSPLLACLLRSLISTDFVSKVCTVLIIICLHSLRTSQEAQALSVLLIQITFFAPNLKVKPYCNISQSRT